jgi:HEAT repeat protein
MPEEPSAAVETPRRSRTVYVLWGIALALLVLSGVLCWTVVVPVWQVRAVVLDGSLNGASDEVIFERLGGKQRALGAFRKYLACPVWIASHKPSVLRLASLCGAEGAVPLLMRFLEDSDPCARMAAAAGLGRLGQAAQPATPPLVMLLDDPDCRVRANAIWALGTVGPHGRLKTSFYYVCSRRGRAAGSGTAEWQIESPVPHLDARQLVPRLTRILDGPQILKGSEDADNVNAAGLLGLLGPRARNAVPRLIKALDDHNPEVARNACWALGRMRCDNQEAVRKLSALLAHEYISMREQAAWSLGRIGPAAKSTVPALRSMLKAKMADERRLAAEALCYIQSSADKEIMRVLEAIVDGGVIVNSPVWNSRVSTCEALGSLGRNGEIAVPLLRKLRDAPLGPAEPDEHNHHHAQMAAKIKKAAADALKKIRAAQEKKK